MGEKEIGVVSNYFEKVGVAAIKLKASLEVGDKIRIIGGGNDFTQKVKSMQINKVNVESAEKGDEIGIKLEGKARKEYKVYKVIGDK